IIQDREPTISRNILNFLPFRIDHYFENIPIASGGYHPINSPLFFCCRTIKYKKTNFLSVSFWL
ncbi:MAG: hypothetical protein OEZ22_12970, partial [Spirochaetia bacterium]|nr:hypothetical protein [Spirochaetia bacterium]